ncbi:MAG: hypothetical protein ACLTT2_04795 [Alphaproteobacteria bacterium]
MKYFKFVCYSLLLMLLFVSVAFVADVFAANPHFTPMSLLPQPFASASGIKVAGIYWLPDYMKGNVSRGSDDVGGGDIDGNCEKNYGMHTPSNIDGRYICSKYNYNVTSSLKCHVNCRCKDEYKYTSSNCSGNYTTAGTSCEGKYNQCVCKSEFKYNSSNCSGEYEVSGTSCGGNYNGCTIRPECTVSSKSCTYGCAEYNSCDRCTSCKSNPDCDVSDKSCTYGCASYNSCSKCTSCKDNPDCSATAVSCDYGCASTNSCGICTSCSGNPDCDVADKSCDYGCAATNSCGKCTSCKSCSNTCDSGYSLTACSSSQVQTSSKTNQCGNPCYQCRAKTCADGGYEGAIPSGKTCTKVAYANLSCYTDCTIIQGNPRLIVNWSYGAGISTPGVRLDAKKNGNSVLLGMMKSGTSGTLIYEDVAVGDLISSFSGYGIANDSTSGSESFNISANVPSVSISEAKDYYINVTLSPADRTPAPNTKADLAVGCYLPSGYTCTISSNTPCSLKGADGKGIGYNLWSGGMSYGSGDMDAGQSVTIDVNSEIKCETGSYYTFVVDYIEIGGKKVDSNTRSFYLKANGDPGNVWVRYRLK